MPLIIDGHKITQPQLNTILDARGLGHIAPLSQHLKLPRNVIVEINR